MLDDLSRDGLLPEPIVKQKIINSLNYLRTLYMEDIVVADNVANIYTGDYYGLLSHLKVEIELWFVVMLLNGLKTSYDYDGLHTVVVVPNIAEYQTFVQKLRVQYGSGTHEYN